MADFYRGRFDFLGGRFELRIGRFDFHVGRFDPDTLAVGRFDQPPEWTAGEVRTDWRKGMNRLQEGYESTRVGDESGQGQKWPGTNQL